MSLDSSQSILDFALHQVSNITLRQVSLAVLAYVVYKFVYYVFLWPHFLSPLRNVPGPPAGNPFIGQFMHMLRAEAGVLQRKWIKQYGPVVRALGPVGIERLIFLNPEAINKILVTEWLDFPRPDSVRNILGLVAGYGLLTVTGDEHRQMRKAMNPAFSIPNLTAQVDMYYDTIEGLVDLLKSQIEAESDPSKGKQFSMYDWVGKVTLDIICETAFGYKADSLHNPHNELAEAYENLLNLQTGANFAKLIVVMSIPGIPALLTSEWAYKHRVAIGRLMRFQSLTILLDSMYRINKISREILAEKIADAANVASSDRAAKRDVMSLLVRARMSEKNDGYQMSDFLIRQQVLTFLGAGHETTASGLAWTLYLLAKDKKVQDKLRREVTPFIASNPHPGYVELKELEWLDCVIMESLRVFPPVPMTWRKSGKDQWLDGVFIPKDTPVYVPIRNVNTWTEVWGEDAEEFKPERWLNLPKGYHPTFSLLSFIAGPHGCIGKNMSITEMKAVLTHLITNFEFDLAYEGQMAKTTAAITMKPEDNMPLRVRLVSQSDPL